MSTNTPTTCTVANGTYVCQRPAGHTGMHEHRAPIVNGANVRTGIRITRFADRYSEARTTRISVPTK